LPNPSEAGSRPPLDPPLDPPKTTDVAEVINKSMDRDDLLTEAGRRFVSTLSALSETLHARHLPVTSWYGELESPEISGPLAGIRRIADRMFGRGRDEQIVGEHNRGGDSYEPIPGIADDTRHPWFLYWEAYWVMTHGPAVDASQRVLDAGGTSSLFSSYLASLGPEVHAVDLNETLLEAGSTIAREMGWNLHSHCMNMADLSFEDACFDHAYSICVFEHLHADLRRQALGEIARVLKPGGTLSITFDYRGPGVFLAGEGFNSDPNNLIRTPADVQRHFLTAEGFEPVGNPVFEDNDESYLAWPDEAENSYTFGSVFLRRTGGAA
jgi:ubiquinone/menaquinone biosynthesis C-methylase UbiE